METEKKYVGGWWIWILILLILTFAVFAVLNYAGLIGKTVVERKVFENSYQRSESLKSQIAIYGAQLIEIESQLSRTDLDQATRSNLEAQASSIRVMRDSARRMQ